MFVAADPTSTNSVGYNPGWQAYIQPWGGLQDLVEQFRAFRSMFQNVQRSSKLFYQLSPTYSLLVARFVC